MFPRLMVFATKWEKNKINAASHKEAWLFTGC